MKQPYFLQTKVALGFTPIKQRLLVGMIFLALLMLYLATLATTLPAGDSSELIASAYTLGIAHPPGYPLFNLLGKLLSFIPLNDVVWRINLLSALSQLAAAFFIYLTIKKLTQHWMAALFAAAFFATAPVVWEYSLKAEVFALNNFFAAIMLYGLMLLRDNRINDHQHHGIDAVLAQRRYYLSYVSIFILALALSHHHTIILLAPMVITFISYYDRNCFLAPKRLMLSIGSLLLGLSVYLYIPLRARHHPYLSWDNAVDIPGFIKLVTRADYGTFKLMSVGVEFYSLIEKYELYAISLIKQFSFIGVALALLGSYALARNPDKLLRSTLLLTFMLTSFIFFILANLPKNDAIYLGVYERFYLLPAVFIAIFIGLGIDYLYLKLSRYKHSILLYCGINILLIAAVVMSVFINYSSVNQRDNQVIYHYGIDILQALKPNALIITRGDIHTNTLDGLTLVYQQRPDIIVLDQEKLTYAWYCEQIRHHYPQLNLPFKRYDGNTGTLLMLVNANIDQRPIYVVGGLKENSMLSAYRLMPVGLVRQVIAKDAWPNRLAYQQANNILWQHMHTPTQVQSHYSKTTFEHEAITNYGLAQFYLAWEYQQRSLYDLAIVHYLRAIKLRPDFADSYKNLGIIYAQHTQEIKKAVACWQKYLILNPNDKENPIMISFIRNSGL